MTKELDIIEASEFYIKQIQKGLSRFLDENIFDEIFKILRDNTVFNDNDIIANAIKSGRLYYANGAFRSDFKISNAVAGELEKLGAKWKNNGYYIESFSIPPKIQEAISFVNIQNASKLAAIQALFNKISDKIAKFDVSKFIDKAATSLFKKLNKDITENAKKHKIPLITWEPGVKEAEKIANDYVYNMNYWIKKWSEKEISTMRKDILNMSLNGARIPQLEEYFKTRWNIKGNKAKFLATNESNIASSVIQATRYQEMGFTHFQWTRSSSKEKRKLHEKYYGQIFPYNNPPIIDEKTGQKGLPRQIYNCKCHARPVMNYGFEENRKKIENAKRNIFTKIKYAIENSMQRNNYPWRYRRFGEGQKV